MKRVLLMGLLAAMFLLTGCPSQTQVAMEPTDEVPAWLVGTWCKVKGSGEKGECYRLDKTAKKGVMTRYDVEGGTALLMSGQEIVLAKVNGHTFVFAYDKGDEATSGEGYYIFELRKQSDKEFVLAGVKEHAIDYEASREEIRKYLQEHGDDAATYSVAETDTYRKQ